MDVVRGRLVVSGCRRRGGEHCNGRFDVQHGHGAHRPMRRPRRQGRGQRGVAHPFAHDTHHLMHVRGRTHTTHFFSRRDTRPFWWTHSRSLAPSQKLLSSWAALRYARTSPSPCGQAQSRPGCPPLLCLCISTCGSFVIFFLSFFVCAVSVSSLGLLLLCATEKPVSLFHCVVIIALCAFLWMCMLSHLSTLSGAEAGARGNIFHCITINNKRCPCNNRGLLNVCALSLR